MKFKTLTLIGLLILLAAHSLPTSGAAPGNAPIQEIQFTAVDFAGGDGRGFAITREGLTLANEAMTAVYTSPIIDAPFAFNAAVPSWQADVPELTGMELMVRTRTTGGEWSQWFDIHANDDWTPEDAPHLVGDMIVVLEVDRRHDQFQFSVSFSRYAGITAPTLKQFTWTVIDSTAGPSTAEMLEQQAALDAARPDNGQATDSYPRPTVISREVWCYYEACDYTDSIFYEPATHMTIHHTVSSNDHTDWAPIVRAIWNYHTYGNEWGDIGYNYLIDRTGVIYEGHLNEDYLNLDVIGTHAAAANAGSMGVSLIGTFTTLEEYPVSDTPPQVMLDAAADLLAWKADQRHIDVYSASRLPYMDWGLPHLMGHRDVYGGTATLCPGGNAYDLLPDLRDAVANRIGFVSPHIYVDELSDAFTMSSSTWYEGPRGCGNNGHSYYTWNVTDEALSDNWGEWRPDVPENGRYEIEVYAPYCDTNGPETDGAVYSVTHADGTDPITISHADDVGLWMSLGEFNLATGTDNLIRLTDLTVNDPTDYDFGVWFDAIRLRPLAASATTTTPADGVWLNQTTVDFAWQIANASSVMTTTIQVATDDGFSDLVYTESWPTAVTTATHTFSQEYADLYWRIQVSSQIGGQVDSPSARFGIDTTAPSSLVDALLYYAVDGTYELQWGGSDNLSGIASYDIEVRANDTLTWTALLTNTTATTTVYLPPDPAKVYWFRSQATDVAGNAEAVHSGDGDINTDQATPVSAMAVENQSPAADVWLNDPLVAFTWVLTNAVDVQTVTWTAATDAAFVDVVATQSWSTAVTNTIHTFSQDYADLYWQVTLTNTANAQVSSDPTRFSLDSTPPATAVYTLTDYVIDQTYELFWQGNDNLSGIAGYTIEYRADTDLTWTTLLTNTTLTSTQFIPADYSQTYWFRSQGVDVSGNVELAHSSDGDINTGQAKVIFDPVVTNQTPSSNVFIGDTTVHFDWTLTHITDVQTSTLQVAIDPGFNDLVATKAITGNVTSVNQSFAQDYVDLFWRVMVEFTPPKAGLIDSVTSTTTHFSLDITPPISEVNAIYKLPSGGYLIQWNGVDAVSEVATYTIEFRAQGDTTWTTLVADTPVAYDLFTPADMTQIYEFRSQATDLVGNVEAPHTGPDLDTTQAILLDYSVMLPIVIR